MEVYMGNCRHNTHNWSDFACIADFYRHTIPDRGDNWHQNLLQDSKTVRNKLKQQIKDEKDIEKRVMAEELLEEIDATLDKHQDKHVKDQIKKLKSKIGV